MPQYDEVYAADGTLLSRVERPDPPPPPPTAEERLAALVAALADAQSLEEVRQAAAEAGA